MMYSLLGKSQDEAQLLDSLENLTSLEHHDTIRAEAYIEMSLLLYPISFDTLKALNEKSRAISDEQLKAEITLQERSAFIRLYSEATTNIAYYYQETGEFETAIQLYQECLNIDFHQHNYEGISTSLNNIGMIHYYKGNVIRALEFFLKSLKIDEEHGDPLALGPSLNNIGYIYEHQRDTIKALEFYTRALDVFEKSEDIVSSIGGHINVGSVLRTSDQQLAIAHFLEALELSRSIGYEGAEASALLNLGNLYFEIGQLDSAEYYLDPTIKKYEKAGDASGLSVAKINKAKVEFKKSNINEAEKLMLEGLNASIEIGNVYNQKAGYELAYEIYKEKGDYKKSMSSYEQFIILRDSLLSVETQQQTYQKSLQYEYDKKEELSEIRHIEELAKAQAEKDKQNLIMWMSIVGLIIVIIFIVVLISRMRLIRDKNKENELLLGEIHHRVKNNLQVISSLLSLQEKSLDDESAKKAILEGKERVKSMGLIHKMLYQNDNYSGIEMDDYIQNLLKGLLDSFGMDKNKIQIETNIHKLKLDVDSAIPVGLIINELVINSLKYAYEKSDQPKMTIQLNKISDDLILKISDNGDGKKVDVENSNSFGYKLVKSLVRQVKGSLEIKEDKGLHYTILIKDYKLV